MSNGFDRAQASYDAAEPPEYSQLDDCACGCSDGIFDEDTVKVFVMRGSQPDIVVLDDKDHLEDLIRTLLGARECRTMSGEDWVAWKSR